MGKQLCSFSRSSCSLQQALKSQVVPVETDNIQDQFVLIRHFSQFIQFFFSAGGSSDKPICTFPEVL
jgi:hypothetical protein